MKDLLLEQDVDFLVETFYHKLQKNDVLAPFFVHTNWEQHLPKMKHFWNFKQNIIIALGCITSIN